MVGITSSLIIIASAALLTLLAILLKRKGIDLTLASRIAALLLVAVAFSRYIYDQPPIYYVIGLDSPSSPFGASANSAFLTGFSIILVWCVYASMLIAVMNEFFRYKTLARLACVVALPVYLIATAFFETYSTALLGGEQVAFSEWRIWILIAECILGIALTATRLLEGVFVTEGKISLRGSDIPLPRTLKQVGKCLYGLAAILVAVMPGFVPQAFIGKISLNIRLYDLTEAHRFMIYLAVVLPFLVYHLIKHKSQDEKRFLMIFASVAFLWSYVGRWNVEMLARPTSWPLHLCNTAMFLIPLCLIFRLEKLFNFCLFINVMGALMAMILPSEYASISAIETERASFWLNHWVAFGMPLILMALKLFKRPKFKEWVYALIEFIVYYVLILFVNAFFTAKYGESDFFFTNSDFIVSTLGDWAERTMDFTATLNIGEYALTFYPLYQSLFFVVYVGFTVAVWFIYELLFASWDAAEDRRNRERDYKRMKKELTDYLGKDHMDEPVSGDSSPKIAIKHFCKRYGSNKHYSVNDVSFEVSGGEIFGFLGPNGAGKSTIIKSMVGIQTITSGNIELCGYDVESQPVLAKLNTGFVPDHYALYENLTGREYINYIADLYQVEEKARDERIEKYVERFQLTGSFDNQMKTYSHGMKQKITIMSALVHDPKVWILDEPLTGLDPTSIHEVKECMKEHAASGKIVFFSSHIIDVVEKICDRIAIIKKGKLRACTTIKELNEKGIELEQFYLNIINAPEETESPSEEQRSVEAAAL